MDPIDNLDHCIIYGRFVCSHYVRKRCYSREVRNYSPELLSKLNINLNAVPWSALLSSVDTVDDCVDTFYQVFNSELNNVIPLRKIIIRPRDKPGMNSEVRKLFRTAHRLHRIAINTKNEVDINNHREARRRAKKAWRKAQKNHYTDLGEKLGTSKIFWKVIKDTYGKKKESSIPGLLDDSNALVTNDIMKANLLNRYFASISTIDPAVEPELPLHIPFVTDSKLDDCIFNEDDVYNVLISLDKDKAAGPDALGNLVLTKCASAIKEPLYYIFRRSIDSGIFPKIWKRSNVTPIYKNGDQASVNNYRPVSLLCCISKVFEKIVYNVLYNYCINNNLLSSNNSGFKKGDGTVNRLLYITEKIHQALDLGQEVGMVFLDISKAFDRVWHKGLLFKLATFGLTGNLLFWIENYLKGREQKVVLAGESSTLLPTNAGVPQGSILGPLLFLIFLNDIEEDIVSDLSLFADDCTLAKAYYAKEDAEQCLNQDLRTISNWANKWLVNFNFNKTVCMNFSHKINKSCLNLHFNQSVSFVSEHKHLGLLFTNDLKWTKHIKNCVSSAYKKLGLLFRLRSYLTRQHMESIYLNVIRPALEYCSVIYDNCSLGDSALLDSVQRRAACTCTGGFKRTPTVNLLNEVGWDCLSLRRRVSKMCLMCKLYTNHKPEYLVVNFVINDSYVGTRAALSNPRRMKEISCRKVSYYNSFFPSCIRQWNALGNVTLEHFTPASLKIKLLDLWRVKSNLKPRPTDYIKASKGGIGKLLSQIRMGLSPLNFHLFTCNIHDNPFCPSCHDSLETANHFFMECPKYSVFRESLMQDISDISATSTVCNNFNIISSEQIYSWIVEGFPVLFQLSNSLINKCMFNTVSKFIYSTKRFSSDIYCYE